MSSNTLIASITIAIAVSIAAIAFVSSQYYIQQAVSDTNMMEICVKYGGEWTQTWNNTHECIRHKEASK